MRTKKPLTQDRKQAVHLSDELATSLVAEAERTTDLPGLLRRYNVTERTYRRFVERVAADGQLAALVTEKRKQLAEVWDAGLRVTADLLMQALQHQARLCMQADRFDPAMVHKLAGALKIVNDAATTRGMVLVQPPATSRKDSLAAKDAGLGDRASGGALSGGRDGAGGGAGPTSVGDPVH